jgi:hypothetical protein
MPSIPSALRELYEWASRQDFLGHDPHDLLTSPLLRRVKSPLLRLAAVQLGRRSPINLHALLRVPRVENPKALALFIMGLLKARERASLDWKAEAEKLGARLLARNTKMAGGAMHSPGNRARISFPQTHRTL